MLYAQIDQAWVQIIVQLGSFGVLAVFLVAYLPRMVNRGLETYDQVVKASKEELQLISQSFRSEVELVRDRADKRSESMAKTIVSSIQEQGQNIKVLMEKLDKMDAKINELLSHPHS